MWHLLPVVTKCTTCADFPLAQTTENFQRDEVGANEYFVPNSFGYLNQAEYGSMSVCNIHVRQVSLFPTVIRIFSF
jgi:hypothetical protein